MDKSVLTLLSAAAAVLGIAGLWFLFGAVDRFTNDNARTPALIAGISCIVLATGLVVLAAVMARKGGGPPHA